MKAQVLIIGTMQCCICGGDMTQADVDKGAAILSAWKKQIPFIGIIAHSNHFWVNEHKQHSTDYELSLRKFALAVAKQNPEFTPKMEKMARVEIAKLEKEYQRKNDHN